MSINLNHSVYGAQFKAFVDFAVAHRDDGTVVRLEGQNNSLLGPKGEVRRVVAKQGDGNGQVWRGDDSKKINNNVRDLFKRTVLAVCGVDKIDQLPANVLSVMREDDFTGGHPLTARRICAVKAAIEDNFRAEADAALDVLKFRFTYFSRQFKGITKAECDARAQFLVGQVKGDVDLLNLLTKGDCIVAKRIVCSSDGLFLSDEQIKFNLEELRRNINELRAATSGDRQLFESFVNRLYMLKGKALDYGAITKMVAAVKNADLTPVHECVAQQTGAKDLEAMFHLHKLVNRVVVSANLSVNPNVSSARNDLHNFYFIAYGVFCDKLSKVELNELYGIKDFQKFPVNCKAVELIAKGEWKCEEDDKEDEQRSDEIRKFASSFSYCADNVIFHVMRDALGNNSDEVKKPGFDAKLHDDEVRPVYKGLKAIVEEGELDQPDDEQPEVIQN